MSGEHTRNDAGRHARATSARWSAMAMLASAGFLAGCFASSSDSGSAGSGPTGSSSATPAQPLLVDVDTGGTLVTTAGNGIGVYVEYQSGGLWRVSWTCDTVITKLSCNFIVDASVATGTLANPTGDGLEASDSLSQASPRQLEAVTTTTTGVDAMLFDATPGAAITVTVSLNAPVSFFFVQDNMVNGGFTGPLTNPLIFQPSTR